MSRRLPSLSALRAFEATIRLKGLAGAAGELGVTPSAVSHQIRQLETELGIKLVRREGRRLALTKAGEQLMPGLQEAFERIATSVGNLKDRETEAPLTIAMLPNFAINWFMPRLERFHARHPEVRVEVTLGTRCVDFGREEVDMAVRLAAEIPSSLSSKVMFRDRLTPVCSPDYAARHGPFRVPAHIEGHPLLVSDGRPVDAWRAWFEAVGLPPDLHAGAFHLASSQLTLQAAANGIGFALCGHRLIEPMVSRGMLVAPFEEAVDEHGTFFVVYPESWANLSRIRKMCTWLLSEANS